MPMFTHTIAEYRNSETIFLNLHNLNTKGITWKVRFWELSLIMSTDAKNPKQNIRELYPAMITVIQQKKICDGKIRFIPRTQGSLI